MNKDNSYSGVQVLEITKPVIDQLYKDKEIDVANDEILAYWPLYQNEYLVLKIFYNFSLSKALLRNYFLESLALNNYL